MDRPIIYSGELTRSVDFLGLAQNTMVAIAKLSEALFGTSTIVDGFTLAPTLPASLSATLGAGQIYELENLEATPYSSLAANTANLIVKQGIALSPQTLTFVPPTTAGYAQCFLVEASYADVDTGNIVAPYYNAADPQVPYSGPGNAGSANNTVRKGSVAVQIKGGIAAPSGTQTVPAPDPGFVGLFVVTLGYGATTVTAGNISTYANAPFLPVKMPGIPNAVQSNEWVYAVDQSASAGTIIASLSPAPAAFPDGLEVKVKAANAAAGGDVANINGIGNLPIKKRGGGATVANDWPANAIIVLLKIGSTWQFVGLAPSDIVIPTIADSQIWHTGTTGGTATAITTTLTPAPAHGASGFFIGLSSAVGFASGANATLSWQDATGSTITAPLVNNTTGAVVTGGEVAGPPSSEPETTSETQIFYDGTVAKVLTSVTSIYNALPPSAFGCQVFTSSGTYTPSSPKVKTALVFATGAGGAGGNSNGGNELTGLGGGAGATAIALVSMIGVTSVAVTIGAGGQPTSASAGQGTYGGAGGTTSFGTYAVAGGGQPGANSASCGGGGAGGTVSAGLVQSGGNPGEGASGDQEGQRGGTGGASYWGGAGLGSDANQPDGSTVSPVAGGNGTAPGAGGGGADSGLISAVPGGAGANGVVVVLEFA